jgi:hypothetical protein
MTGGINKMDLKQLRMNKILPPAQKGNKVGGEVKE